MQSFTELMNQARSEGVERFSTGIELVNGNGSILLVRRVPDDFLGGLWELPGGGLDNDESLWECLVRESWEETGVTPSSAKYVSSFEYQKQSLPDTKVRQFNFICSDWQGDIVLCAEEHDAYMWADEDSSEVKGCSVEMQEVVQKMFAWIKRGDVQNADTK